LKEIIPQYNEEPDMDVLDMEFTTDDARWQAVMERDAMADAAFFYAVRSTGIYCRPSCPSRLARRDHVEFYLTVLAAEQAGFRACKRCSPEQTGTRGAMLALAACRQIEAALKAGEPEPALAALAASAGLSRFYFQRVFRQVVGVTPKAFAAVKRAHCAAAALAGGAPVTEAIYEAGYASPRGFYEQAAPRLGMAPHVFRNDGQGETIRFATGQCSLGAFLVAATAKGVCAVSLGDDPDFLLRALQDRFAKAALIGADAEFEQLVGKIVAVIEAKAGAPITQSDLPLDIRGTAFQQKVWQALRDIPLGMTATYSGIAAQIGLPNAMRAVASACAANPLAIVIPCHRVVRTGGALSGYRWGIARKQALLQREAMAADGDD
jgi:AraC family transcriptional regulator of adaptative response/methylated-DNA-[protein]-cysteine methyltransferase